MFQQIRDVITSRIRTSQVRRRSASGASPRRRFQVDLLEDRRLLAGIMAADVVDVPEAGLPIVPSLMSVTTHEDDRPIPIPTGDFNMDGVFDIDMDGMVDGADFNLWNANRFTGTQLRFNLEGPNDEDNGPIICFPGLIRGE